MSEINAAEVLEKARTRLKVIHARAVYALRAASARGEPANQKTVEVLAKCIEVGEYAESIQLMLSGVEEDGANAANLKEIDTISGDLDKVAAAIHRFMHPDKQEPEGPRLDRSSK